MGSTTKRRLSLVFLVSRLCKMLRSAAGSTFDQRSQLALSMRICTSPLLHEHA